MRSGPMMGSDRLLDGEPLGAGEASMLPGWGASSAGAAFLCIALASVVLYRIAWVSPAELIPDSGVIPGTSICLIGAWLAWRERGALALGHGWWPGLVLVLIVGTLWLVAAAADILLIRDILLQPVLFAAALAHFGIGAGRVLAFPIVFTYFAWPPQALFHGTLLDMTTVVSSTMARIFGIPVLVEGNLISIPEGQFEVADGCAGVGYFIYAGCIAALYGYLRLTSWPLRIALFFLGLSLAVIMNWVRVSTVILVGHFSHMQHYVVRVEHESLGWSLFALAMIIFFFLAGKVEKVDASRGAMKATGTRRLSEEGRRSGWRSLAVTLVVLSLPPAVWAIVSQEEASDGTVPELGLPMAFGEWSEVPAEVDESSHPGWRPDYWGTDSELHRRYASTDGTIEVWLMLYGRQSQGKELVTSGNSIADSATWSIVNRRRLASDPPMIESEIVAASGERRIVRWWYEVAGWNTISPMGAKLRQVAGLFSGRQEAGLVAISAACRTDCATGRQALDLFAEESSADLRAAIYAHRFRGEL